MSDPLRPIQRAIDLVETHLFEKLPLGSIAAHGACSPWHFHRLFVAVCEYWDGTDVRGPAS